MVLLLRAKSISKILWNIGTCYCNIEHRAILSPEKLKLCVWVVKNIYNKIRTTGGVKFVASRCLFAFFSPLFTENETDNFPP